MLLPKADSPVKARKDDVLAILPKAGSPYDAGGLARTGVTAKGGFTRFYGDPVQVLPPKAGSPLTARELLDRGMPAGPEIGRLLREARLQALESYR